MYVCAIQFPQITEKIQSGDKDAGVLKAAAQEEILSSSRVKPFTLYHASKRLTFTTALQLRACNRLKCGGWKKKPEIPQWLNMVDGCQNSRQKETDSGNITQGDKNRFQKWHKDFFFLLFFEPRQLSTCNWDTSRVNKEAMCAREYEGRDISAPCMKCMNLHEIERTLLQTPPSLWW